MGGGGGQGWDEPGQGHQTTQDPVLHAEKLCVLCLFLTSYIICLLPIVLKLFFQAFVFLSKCFEIIVASHVAIQSNMTPSFPSVNVLRNYSEGSRPNANIAMAHGSHVHSPSFTCTLSPICHERLPLHREPERTVQ